MGPIELLYVTIGVIITLIGLARGYVKELGSTLIILSALFLLTFFEDEILDGLEYIGCNILNFGCYNELNGFYSLVFTTIFVAIVFAGYAGKTLTFRGTPVKQPGRFFLDISVGALNGYLIAGTLWYYQDIFGYPLRGITGFQEPLTMQAQRMIQYLPPNLFSNPVYWIVPVVILLIISVRG
jgi:hypothetical protein